MKLLWLLLSAVLFGIETNAASQQHPPTTTAAPATTTVVTTTVFRTVTQTVTHTETRTRKAPCPTGRPGILNFDDLAAATVAPMPLVYQDFNFPASSSWEYITAGAFPASSSEFRSASSCPNGLLSRAHGAVSFNTDGRGFSFDITSAAFFAFAPGGADTLLVEVGLRMADGYVEMRYFDVQNGARDPAAAPAVLGPADLGAFKDLVEVSVAVWASFDQAAGDGVSAQFVLDDIEYVRRSCGPAY